MIKVIQNWLDIRKQYKLEQQRQELINVAKVILSDIVRELVKYDIRFYYMSEDDSKICRHGLTYGETDLDLDLFAYHDKIQIKIGVNTIAIYEHLKWYQHFTKKSTKKKFYYAEDAVKAISNMIIMGEAL